MGQGMVDGGEVLRDDIAALAAVALLDHVLDALHGFIARQHAGDREEAGLQHRIDPAAKPGVARDLRSVDDEQPQALVDDFLLRPSAAGDPTSPPGS